MRTRQPGIRHQDALDRRLALLGEELAWLRPDPPESPPAGSPRPGAPGERTAAAPARPWWHEHTRVAGGQDGDPPGQGSTPAPTAAGAWSEPDSRLGVAAVPAPGRHAARRSPARVEPERVPGPTEEPPLDRPLDRPPGRSAVASARLLLGPAQLTVVGIVVVLALGITCWWLARGRPDSTVALRAAPAVGLTRAPDATTGATGAGGAGGTTQAAVASAIPTAAGSAGASAAAGAVATGTVTVDVAGKVRRPGVQVLPAGSRVDDAITAAGGAKSGVDLTPLNLAQVLADGQQVLVGVAGSTGTSTVSGPSAGTSSTVSSAAGTSGGAGAVQVVDLNTATADQLDTLPDVGPVTAQSILSWRDAHGGFSSVDELLEVDGIGQVTLGKLAPYVTV